MKVISKNQVHAGHRPAALGLKINAQLFVITLLPKIRKQYHNNTNVLNSKIQYVRSILVNIIAVRSHKNTFLRKLHELILLTINVVNDNMHIPINMYVYVHTYV